MGEYDNKIKKALSNKKKKYIEGREEAVRNTNGFIDIDINKIENGEKGTTIFKDDVITLVLRNIEQAGFDRNMARKLTSFCVSLAVGTEPGEAYLRCLSKPGKDDYTRDPEKYAKAYLMKYPILSEMTNRLTIAFQRKIADEAVKGYQATSSEVLTNLRNLYDMALEDRNIGAAIKISELLGKNAGLWESRDKEQNIIIQSNIPGRIEKNNAVKALEESKEEIILPDINPHLVRGK